MNDFFWKCIFFFGNEKKAALNEVMGFVGGIEATCAHSCINLICEPFESVIYSHLSNQRPNILCALMWFAIEIVVFLALAMAINEQMDS